MASIEIKRMIDLNLPNILMIPGGPGLGPNSFYPMEKYLLDMNVYYYHPTPSEEQDKCPSYDTLLADLKSEANKFSNLYLCGHSFGGIISADLATTGDFECNGLICISTPLSVKTFAYAHEVFGSSTTEENQLMNHAMEKYPNDENYKKWFASYAHFYFSPTFVKLGQELLLNDSVNYKAFLGAASDTSKKEILLSRLKEFRSPLIMIGAELDPLFTLENLIFEADQALAKFAFLEDAGHFSHFEKPKQMAQIITDFINEQRT